MKKSKITVFVIMPFDDQFLRLFDKPKRELGDKYVFTNAGDMNNQRNILKDIVSGIESADIIVADLTNLNPNVMYELGVAHTMNKRTVHIIQDIGQLPFDMSSYRVIPYGGMDFDKVDELICELKKGLDGVANCNIKCGNPVADYSTKLIYLSDNSDVNTVIDEDGYLDLLDHISTYANDISSEFIGVSDITSETANEINKATAKLKIAVRPGHTDVSLIRRICTELAEPINTYASGISKYTASVLDKWNKMENDYIRLLDNKFLKDKNGIKTSVGQLNGMRTGLESTDDSVEQFILSLQKSLGMENNLTFAINNAISKLKSYQDMTKMVCSSIDRMINKANIVVDSMDDEARHENDTAATIR